jgi:hypothetical protein
MKMTSPQNNGYSVKLGMYNIKQEVFAVFYKKEFIVKVSESILYKKRSA